MLFTPKGLLSEELEGEESVWIFILFELKEFCSLPTYPFKGSNPP
jgi:hypothetical protein